MDAPTTILGVLGLALAILFWFVKELFSSAARKRAEHEKRQKEIEDAINSGDVSRIHAAIDRLRDK